MSESASNKMSFKRPVPVEFTNQFFKTLSSDAFGLNGMLSEETLRIVVRQAFQQPGVSYFLQKFFARNRCYSDAISDMVLLNQENKLLMNISDDDMDEYIRNNVDKTKPATPKLVAGRWENQHDTKRQTYDMQKDLTVSMTNQTEINVTFFVEDEGVNVSVLAPVVETHEIVGTFSEFECSEIYPCTSAHLLVDYEQAFASEMPDCVVCGSRTFRECLV